MISCSEYDYIEIVCLYRYPVRLTLKSGSKLEGVALDTKRNEDKAECIEIEHQGKGQLVELDLIAKLTVLVENPHFTQVEFS